MKCIYLNVQSRRNHVVDDRGIGCWLLLLVVLIARQICKGLALTTYFQLPGAIVGLVSL